MRVLALVFLAALIVPDASVSRAAQDVENALAGIATVCDRSPESCDQMTETARDATRQFKQLSAMTLRETKRVVKTGHDLLDTILNASVDRGTLKKDDLTPAWRGDEG